MFLNYTLNQNDLDFEVVKKPDPEITEKTHDLVNHVDKLMSKLQCSMDHVATGQLTAPKAQAFNAIMARLNEV